MKCDNDTSMPDKYYLEAKKVFDAYCEHRKAQGLSVPEWTPELADYAYMDVTGCAAKKTLINLIGIPKSKQTHISDVVQYATWHIAPEECLLNWLNSPGHRRQLECETTTKAAAAAYQVNGVWYYSIVYDFVGVNQAIS